VKISKNVSKDVAKASKEGAKETGKVIKNADHILEEAAEKAVKALEIVHDKVR
jgi:hypothetical protein